MLRSALRFAIGGAAGFLLWLYVTPAYNSALAGAASVIRVDPRFRDARLVAVRRSIEVVQSTAPSRAVPADQLTYNIVLLLGLFAMRPRFFRDRNMRALALSLAVLAIGHWLALLVTIESGYSQHLGDWSAAHYTRGEAYVWAIGEYFYRLAGMFGIAFACWWLSAEESALAGGHHRGSRKRPGLR